MWKSINRENYLIEVDEPQIYVDNQKRGRSGHMSHAMAEFAPDTIIDFNSNCSAVRYDGHSAFGWIEYRISKDAGRTFSEVRELPYAKKAFEDGIFTVSVEKAVACDDGTIVAFCLRNDVLHPISCEPWFTPMSVSSNDGGNSWSDAIEVSPYRGRIYDAVYHNGVIYVLHFCNDAEETFTGCKDEHLYRIYISRDNGKSFEELCVVPFKSTHGRGYGSMLFDSSGRLHVYAYNINAERKMDHIVSEDLGKTWNYTDACYLEKGIRNPQTALLNGVFILHGRGENARDFVLYTSQDGYKWDQGEYIGKNEGGCYYSNNIVLNSPNGGKRLLIQYSDLYQGWARVNTMHMWLEIKNI